MCEMATRFFFVFFIVISCSYWPAIQCVTVDTMYHSRFRPDALLDHLNLMTVTAKLNNI